MKKSLLLAGIACLVSASAAQAMDYNGMKPYVGLDYAYSDVDFKKDAKAINSDFSSGIVSVGAKINKYSAVEAFYQLAGEEKGRANDIPYKGKFSAYGLDAIGHMPLGCEHKFELLGSLGLGIYDINIKKDGEKNASDKVGYRIGLGAQYNFTDNMAARIMARYNYIGMAELHSMNEVTAGIRYTF